METIFSREKPISVLNERACRILNYNIQETPISEIEVQWKFIYGEDAQKPDEWFIEEHKYMYNEVRIPQGQWNYGGIVNAIVRDKYLEDEMEAITNNMNVIVAEFFNVLVTDGIAQAIKYLLTSIKEDNMANFKDMQEWRAMAKREAKKVLNIE